MTSWSGGVRVSSSERRRRRHQRDWFVTCHLLNVKIVNVFRSRPTLESEKIPKRNKFETYRIFATLCKTRKKCLFINILSQLKSKYRIDSYCTIFSYSIHILPGYKFPKFKSGFGKRGLHFKATGLRVVCWWKLIRHLILDNRASVARSFVARVGGKTLDRMCAVVRTSDRVTSASQFQSKFLHLSFTLHAPKHAILNWDRTAAHINVKRVTQEDRMSWHTKLGHVSMAWCSDVTRRCPG